MFIIISVSLYHLPSAFWPTSSNLHVTNDLWEYDVAWSGVVFVFLFTLASGFEIRIF